MLPSSDLYTKTYEFKIAPTKIGASADSKDDPTTIGLLQVEVQVRQYTDTRNLKTQRAYLIAVKQRVIIANPNNVLAPQKDEEKLKKPILHPSSSFTYPVLIRTWMDFHTKDPVPHSLVEYSPKTVNTAINTSTTGGQSSSTGSSTQHTTGSSQSETNSYDVSVNRGFFGDAATGGASASYGHSSTQTTEQSDSAGMSSGRDVQSSTSNSMSLKDWAAYAFVDAGAQSPTWLWGQEYPWDVLQFHNTFGTDNVLVPEAVRDRLFIASIDNQTSGDDKKPKYQAVPPSNLAQFGINFVSHARWYYPVGDAAEDKIRLVHALKYFEGTHSVPDGDHTQVTIQISEYEESSFSSPDDIDLGLLALDPIGAESSNNGAIVGFARSQFIAQPASDKTFSIKSAANKLYVTGEGFDAPADGDSPLKASFASLSTPTALHLNFKIVDPDQDYSLYLKHWKTTDNGCKLTITINGDATLVRHIDSTEAGGGSDNVMKIWLRNRDYTSVEFYDYLKLGLNRIDIVVEPEDPAKPPCGYALRACAIG
jgi:hypothetical protein